MHCATARGTVCDIAHTIPRPCLALRETYALLSYRTIVPSDNRAYVLHRGLDRLFKNRVPACQTSISFHLFPLGLPDPPGPSGPPESAEGCWLCLRRPAATCPSMSLCWWPTHPGEFGESGWATTTLMLAALFRPEEQERRCRGQPPGRAARGPPGAAQAAQPHGRGGGPAPPGQKMNVQGRVAQYRQGEVIEMEGTGSVPVPTRLVPQHELSPGR